MSTTPCSGVWVRALRRIDQLHLGDRVFTPARRWETVIGLRPGDRYARSIQVVTDATGPDYPWAWTTRHTVATMRRTLPRARATSAA